MIRPSLPRTAAALLLAAALQACGAGGSKVYNEIMIAPYDPNELRLVSQVPLVVLGTPPDGSSPEEVAAAMGLPARLGGAELVPAPAGTPGDRFVVGFFPGNAYWLCRRRAPEPGVGETLDLVFAYCRGVSTLSGARLSDAGSRGPRDEGFRPAILQLYGTVLPNRNPITVRPPGA